jgi:hypothetical protein
VSVDGKAAHANPTVKPTICLVNLFASTPPLDRRMSNLGSVLAKKHLFLEHGSCVGSVELRSHCRILA